jgi:sialate O-acetylesterase
MRYAWANNPEVANLYNKEGLPASPFRTSELY